MVKKRKSLDSAMEQFVFGTPAAEPVPATSPGAEPEPTRKPEPTPEPTLPPEFVAAAAPEPALEPKTPEAKPPARKKAPAASSAPKSKTDLISQLRAPEKEPTVRFTVDMPESLHRKLSILAAQTGRKKVDIVRMLLEEKLGDLEE